MRSLAIIAAFAALGGFLFGYDLGLIGGAMLDIEVAFDTTVNEQAAIVGSAKLGAVLGTFLGGAYMYRFGRLQAIAANSVFFIAGPTIMAAAQSVAALVVGRFVIGLGVGTSAVVVPAYLGEMAPPSIRGAVVIVYEIMLCIGMMSSTLVDACLQTLPGNWRWMVGTPILPALLLGIAPWVLPESPRWLVMRGNLHAALAALHQVKYSQRLQPGVESTPEVEHELMLLWDAVERDRALDSPSPRPQQQLSASILRVPLESQDRATGGKPVTRTNSLPDVATSVSPAESLDAVEAAKQRARVGSGAPKRDNVFADLDVFSCAARSRTSGTLAEVQSLAEFRVDADSASGPDTGTACLATSLLNPVANAVADPAAAESPASPEWAAAQQGALQRQDTSSSATPKEPQYDSEAKFRHVLLRQMASSAKLLVCAVSPGLWPRQDGCGRVGDDVAERRAVRLALALAVFNQVSASTSLISYAPDILQHAGVEGRQRAMQFSAAISACKTIGILFGITLVDKAGRRPPLLCGSIGCSVAMFALAYGRYEGLLWVTLASMCSYMFVFSASWAGIFWVLCSELFSMSIKSAAMALATATLFASGAAVDLAFPGLVAWLGGGAFVVFGVLAAAGGVYVFCAVPETKGLSLMQIQELLQHGKAPPR